MATRHWVPFLLLAGGSWLSACGNPTDSQAVLLLLDPITQRVTVKNTAASDVAECHIHLSGEIQDTDTFLKNRITLEVLRAAESIDIPLSSFPDYSRSQHQVLRPPWSPGAQYRSPGQYFLVDVNCRDGRWWNNTVYSNQVDFVTQ